MQSQPLPLKLAGYFFGRAILSLLRQLAAALATVVAAERIE
jgi:hypothetical protein